MTELTQLPNEKLKYSFDFSARAEVVAGETLSSPVVTVNQRRGSGSLTITGTTVVSDLVEFFVEGGDLGDVFWLECVVDTSGGSTLEDIAQLTIVKA
jgi:hypothetical protein